MTSHGLNLDERYSYVRYRWYGPADPGDPAARAWWSTISKEPCSTCDSYADASDEYPATCP